MDREILELISQAEKNAEKILKTANDDALELVDDATRNTESHILSEIRNERQSEIGALRKLTELTDDELNRKKKSLEKEINQTSEDMKTKIDEVARMVASEVKTEWQ